MQASSVWVFGVWGFNGLGLAPIPGPHGIPLTACRDSKAAGMNTVMVSGVLYRYYLAERT